MHPDHDLPLEDVPYALRERVLAATLVAVMATGAWQAVAAWRNPDALAGVPATRADFTEGRTTLALEKQMDKHLPARDDIIAFANGARYLLLRGTGDDVRAGRDGWLFLTEELRYDTPIGEPLQTRVKLLSDTHSALQERGVRLLVALVPDKARVQSDRLLSGEYPGYSAERYRRALEDLRGHGVEVVDLLTPFAATASQDNPLYYRTDTHWNTRGAALAAEAIARAAYPDGGCSPATDHETRVETEAHAYPGDLRRMIGLEHMPAWFPPRSDMEAPAVTTAVQADGEDGEDGEDGGDGGGLFGDSTVPVVLAGTSFSLRGNFHGALEQAFGCTVLNTAQDGGGFLTSATQYFKDDAFLQSTPAVVVWEVPERFLTLKLDGEADFLRAAGLQP